jgi:D-glycero-alpha-D-manno-heptose-7-phosphate kinase
MDIRVIISRTPYRISFFGGGTDYHTWYEEHGGAVLSTTINHYCYLSCRHLPPFFEHKHRVVWKITEEVKRTQYIQHPVVRAALEFLNVEAGMEIQHQGDLPARSGLGSSSSFTVGLLNAIYALKGITSSKHHLACEAVHIERGILKENVGVQDQIAAAYGGLNKIIINPDGEFSVNPVVISKARKDELNGQLMLFYTGVSRIASHIAGAQINSMQDRQQEMKIMRSMVDDALEILTSKQDIADFGRLLHEAWMIKKGLTSGIAPNFVDDIYLRARNAGAIGGKLLGAGGGGFMLFFVPVEKQNTVKNALHDLLQVPFQFESGGSQLIFYEGDERWNNSETRRDYYHLQPSINELNINRISNVRLVSL